MASENPKSRPHGGLFLRLAMPMLILGLGWFGFSKISVEVEEEPRPPAKKRIPRTRVQQLTVSDYPIRIQTYGIVQAHDPVTLGGPLIVLYHGDLETAQDKILTAGGTITKEIFGFPGGERFQFTDPDGYELAVWRKSQEVSA